MDESLTAPDEKLVAEVELTRARPIVIHRWFIAFAAIMAATGVMILLSPTGSVTRTYAWFFGCMSLACSFIPLPTAPLICCLAGPAGLSPYMIATVGAIGTCIANMNDYYIVTLLYRWRPVKQVRYTRLYKRLATMYNRAPFAALTAASFLPIPIDVVRLLSISEGYSRVRFTGASFLGRWLRYVLLALFTERFNLGWQWIAAILLVTIIAGLWHGGPRIVSAIRTLADRRASSANTRNSEGDSP